MKATTNNSEPESRKQVKKKTIKNIGLDVHKNSISIEIADEALRDLVQAREDAIRALRTAKQQLVAFLLRHGVVYSGRSK